ncbi:MAG: hypothetical protein RJB66_106 [Pseudomonadota bacterium]
MNFSTLWQSLNKRLPEHRTYIVPTKLGLYFAVLCLILLGIAFIYNNNIAYFSCFSLTSLGFITMFQTNFNMHRLRLTVLPPQEIFADYPTKLQVLIENTSTQPVYDVDVFFEGVGPQTPVSHVEQKSTTAIEIPVILTHRGLHPYPTLIAQTTFPLGLLRSWKILRPQEKLLVFPARKGSLQLPPQGELGPDESNLHRRSPDHGQDFLGHRPYQSFDSLRHIDWKAYARHQKLNVKLFETENQGSQLLSWRQTNQRESPELRISQLSQWIDVCRRKKLKFVLETPRGKSSADSSHEHAIECLTQLSLLDAAVLSKGTPP